MKQGWEIKKLGEVCNLYQPRTISGEMLVEDGKYLVYGANGIIGRYNEYNHENSEVLLTCRGATCGTINVSEPYSWINGNAMVVQPKNDNIGKIYLQYLLQAVDWGKVITGAAQPQITRQSLSPLDVIIPPREEQERIAEILDREFERIDALKANAEQSLQHAKDLFQSALKQELQPKEGWVTYRLQDVCTEYGDYGMSLSSKPYDGIRYLRITDITEWGDLNNEMVSADTDVVDERYILREGDILFARTGATVGKTLVYNESMGCCSYAGYLIRYRLNQSIILPLVMYYITHSKEYYEWIVSNQKSATLPNISAKLYNSYEICIPKTLTEQNEMISRLGKLKEHCKTLEENYAKTIALCDDMKKALLRKAFNGEL